MLAWANENWNVSDGGESEVLMEQAYSDADHRAHIIALLEYFRDPRYIRIDNRPVFAIYRDFHIPDVSGMIKIFRQVAREKDLDLYLCRFDTSRISPDSDPITSGFDAAIEFQPFSKSFREFNEKNYTSKKTKKVYLKKLRRHVRNLLFELGIVDMRKKSKQKPEPRPTTDQDVMFDMNGFVEFDLARAVDPYKSFPCVTPSWDNSPRRSKGGATIFLNSSPSLFRRWVAGKVRKFSPFSKNENLFFINAWNEWAEGNHLEPCQNYGLAYLEALREGMAEPQSSDD